MKKLQLYLDKSFYFKLDKQTTIHCLWITGTLIESALYGKFFYSRDVWRINWVLLVLLPFTVALSLLQVILRYNSRFVDAQKRNVTLRELGVYFCSTTFLCVLSFIFGIVVQLRCEWYLCVVLYGLVYFTLLNNLAIYGNAKLACLEKTENE
jgi:hypothetical protein